MTTATKISQFIKKSNPSDPDAQEWAGYAGALTEAILQRAFEISSDELRAFVSATETGKRFADEGHERALASAAVIAQRALLSPAENKSSNELTSVASTARLKIYGLDSVKLGAAYEECKRRVLRSDPDAVVIVNPSMSDADWSYVRELQESGHSVLALAKVEHAPAETQWLGAPAKAA